MPATIFKGSKVKTLKSTLTLNDLADIIPSTTNPQSVAVDAPAGSLLLKTDDGSVYRKLDAGSTTNWALVGSEGSSGINFLGLSSTWNTVSPTDRDAELSVGNWVAYADAAGVAPVDMSGGSPTVAISRTTTSGEVLNGSASFKIVKDAANRQGEGVSVVAYVPEGYRGKTITVRFPFKVISGSLVGGDLDCYVYDVTNSQVIAPFNKSVVGSLGELVATFPVSTNTAQIRVGLHFASTSALALTLSFDDVFVGPREDAIGAAITDVQRFTPTTYSFGTVSNASCFYSRIGDKLHIYGTWTVGSPAAGELGLAIPGGYAIDAAKVASEAEFSSNSFNIHGTWVRMAAVAYPNTSVGPFLVATDGSATDRIFFANSSNATELIKATDASVASGDGFAFHCIVPVANASSNVTISESAVKKISGFLANGTRVTGSAPTQLGQYRSYLRDAGALTYTETNGAPTAAPSVNDGIRIYNGNAFGSADTNNEPTRYEIFVGQNKNVSLEWYASAGRTGVVDADPISSTDDYGYLHAYDPATGIVTVVANRVSGGATTHSSGLDATGGTAVNDIYFDIKIAENALAVGMDMRGVITKAYAELTTNTSTTNAIPVDNTIPQSSEGDEILTVSILPKSGSSKLRIRAQIQAVNSGANDNVLALFRDAGANAIQAAVYASQAGDYLTMVLECEVATVANTSTTLKLRAGTSAGTLYINGADGGGALFGGVQKSTLIVEEINL